MDQPVVTCAAERPQESWNDPVRGVLNWVTLFSRDITPTSGLSAGIATLPPGGGSRTPHRHVPAEIYLILEGKGILTLDGRDSVVEAGSAIFIPGHAAHCLRNDTEAELRLFYVFPTDRFSDVVYRFEE